MKLNMEGRSGAQDRFPGKHHKHYDVITCGADGGILLGTSSLTSRRWYGSIWYYQDSENLTDPFKCASAVSIESGVNDLCWYDGKVFVAGLDTGAVASWEVNSDETPFRPLWEATEHDDVVSCVAVFQPENKAVTAGYDGVVKIWDIEDDIGNSIRTYRGHSDIITSLDHRKDLPVFVTSSLDGTVIVWDTRQAKPARQYQKFRLFGPRIARWQPGSDCLAIGDSNGQVHFGDLKNDEFEIFKAHSEKITTMEFSSCGSKLASGGHDCTVKVHDIHATSVPLLSSEGHRDYVQSLTWRDKEVLSCAYDGQILKHVSGETMELNGLDSDKQGDMPIG